MEGGAKGQSCKFNGAKVQSCIWKGAKGQTCKLKGAKVQRSQIPQTLFSTVATCVTIPTVTEKDTAAAAQAAVGCPKAAIGRQRAGHRLRLATTAQLRPPICLKNYSLAYD